MGLIKAAIGTIGGTLADQWKEFFYCDALTSDILAVKGQKRVSRRSSNTKASDNIISSGSAIAVADGQCMIIVEQGKIVEVCAEPGEFIYDSSTEPSIFSGNLGESILNTFRIVGRRFTYGGDTGKDQRVYYFNTKEIVDNKYGTPNPVPFRVVDRNIGLDIDISVRCNGTYSYKIVDPLLFYTNVCGNVEAEYSRSQIDAQLKAELLSALQPAFAKISEMGVRYSALPGHTMEITEALDEVLTEKWRETRGIAIVSLAINSVTAPKEDEEMIKQAQHTAIMRDPTMAAATIVGAQSDAMRSAAANEAGAMMGFMGLSMAQQAGNVNPQNLFAMGQQPVAAPAAAKPGDWVCACGNVNQGNFCSSCGKPKPQPVENTNDEWICSCGTKNTGKFCTECASPRPQKGWVCACGAINKGKFCSECGKPKPVGEPLYRCDKCGWEPEDPKHPPKFCPECGDRFDENDQR